MTATIELAGVGKEYVKYHDAPMLAHALIKLAARTRSDRLWALRGVDLTVEPGECMGVIGRNGSGKSTMLQLLGGITAPTEGTVTVRGRVAPLISVGVGFHPELTGRDNVFLNGAILGMTRREIESRFDAIVDFAEIEDFIDTPVKFYSSGMQVRLGFAVAVQADPNVLLVDEVLAVGDFAFQMKCLRRIDEIRASGATVLLVSHNLSMVERLCPRTMVLHDGTARFNGPTAEAIATLHSLLEAAEVREEGGAPLESGIGEVVDFALLDESGHSMSATETGSRVVAKITVKAHCDIDHPFVALSIDSPRGDRIFHKTNRVQSRFPPLRAGEERAYTIAWTAQFPTGSYTARLFLARIQPVARMSILDHAEPVLFYVQGAQETYGVVDIQADFSAGS